MELPDLAGGLNRHRARFPGPHLEMVIESMLAGNTAGRLWEFPQDDAEPLVLLWDRGNNVVYGAGDPQTQTTLAALRDVVATDIRPESLAAGRSYFKACALSPKLEAELPAIFAGIELRASPTLFFVHEAAREVGPHTAVPPEVEILPMTREALVGDRFGDSDEVRDEIRAMWPSEERFYRYGLGTLAVAGRDIVCWCTAEYASRSRCGIGIATAPRFQRRGIATATAARFVQEAHRRGITPYWECGRANEPSVRVAEKAGFRLLGEETYWLGRFDGR